jgi:dTDP-4-amino-4,6-dideoxygalactose transaminase
VFQHYNEKFGNAACDSMITIPFNKPALIGAEYDCMRDAIAENHISGDGVFTRKVHAVLEEILPGSKTFLTTSCTHALEMAALLLNLGPGDEFIAPSFTFVSTLNAFILRGARPVFADIRPDTLNLDEARLEPLITRRTRAIVVVHYAGIGCAMDDILRVAERHGIPVVEDNAHGLMGNYKGKRLGTFGLFATQSFHETKNFTCGEGGALVVNDEKYHGRAEILREKGTNRSRFFRGQVDKYTWVDVGSSYLPSDLLAAYLYVQLSAREKIQAKRKAIWERYWSCLQGWALQHNVGLPHIPQNCDQPYHMFYLLMPTLEDRQALISYLGKAGICAVFHYLPLHLSPVGLGYGGRPGDCPVTEDISDRLVRLPFFYDFNEEDQQTVIRQVQGFQQWREPAIH